MTEKIKEVSSYFSYSGTYPGLEKHLLRLIINNCIRCFFCLLSIAENAAKDSKTLQMQHRTARRKLRQSWGSKNSISKSLKALLTYVDSNTELEPKIYNPIENKIDEVITDIITIARARTTRVENEKKKVAEGIVKS